ncbi:uncharacterized protein PAN0_009c3712 [Moesziomyces antarcticus]|uniref:Uncharacterized protein n=1 Tax=Pseudozyma antarctica TaxID=84753 RepID=A0A081CFP9_PSEA2|nr:uncharacterized protein PAN0_009c3712 [Moesziomyces antarcticus]GAK65495.1 hypothetical protein PAN0_009c3712 [Moesziomyces antarcticus]
MEVGSTASPDQDLGSHGAGRPKRDVAPHQKRGRNPPYHHRRAVQSLATMQNMAESGYCVHLRLSSGDQQQGGPKPVWAPAQNSGPSTMRTPLCGATRAVLLVKPGSKPHSL